MPPKGVEPIEDVLLKVLPPPKGEVVPPRGLFKALLPNAGVVAPNPPPKAPGEPLLPIVPKPPPVAVEFKPKPPVGEADPKPPPILLFPNPPVGPARIPEPKGLEGAATDNPPNTGAGLVTAGEYRFKFTVKLYEYNITYLVDP
jgi:hypothetical protein